MAQRTPAPRARFVVADVCRLDCAAGSVGMMVDKATLDTLCNVSAAAGAAMLREAARVLRSDGVFLCITTGAPEERLPPLLSGGEVDIDLGGEACASDAPRRFELLQHTELRRGTLLFHAYALRRCAA